MPAHPSSLPLPIPTEFSAPFWEAARQQKLVIQYCPESGKYQHYPRPVSIYTGKRNVEWREVSGKGFVYAVTITQRGPPHSGDKSPISSPPSSLTKGCVFSLSSSTAASKMRGSECACGLDGAR